MFRSFNEADFWKEIEEKDFLSLKVDTRIAMLTDPTFSGHEVDDVLDVLKKRVPEIFEEEVRLSYEERLDDRSKWDKPYFTKLTFWFQENFALRRIPHIKEVGRAVYKDLLKPQENPKNPPKAPAQKQPPKAGALFAGIAAGIAALVLIVLALVRLLGR